MIILLFNGFPVKLCAKPHVRDLCADRINVFEHSRPDHANGNREENASDIDTNDLSDTECAVIVDEKAHRHCLGLKEGEDIKSGITVRYTEIKGEDGNYKAIIYDNQDPPNVIAIQTCRSKSGPGGSVNDTIHYGKDYQRCLAKHTIQNDRCG